MTPRSHNRISWLSKKDRRCSLFTGKRWTRILKCNSLQTSRFRNPKLTWSCKNSREIRSRSKTFWKMSECPSFLKSCQLPRSTVSHNLLLSISLWVLAHNTWWLLTSQSQSTRSELAPNWLMSRRDRKCQSVLDRKWLSLQCPQKDSLK